MSSKPMTGAVVFAKNIARVAKFYEEMMSMSVVHADGDHVVLESACVQLVVHGIPKRIADTIEIADPPEIREQTPIKLFFPVPSLAEARTKAPPLGGKVGPRSKEWEARGFRACDGHDPEGNVLQFRENAP
jgi:predicted enzyme related to lactoylglutathione lyase